MSRSALFRNGLFAIILLLLVVTLEAADLPFTEGVEEYVTFVLTTDFDYRPWLAELRSRIPLPDVAGFGWLDASPDGPSGEASR
ncbi:MAG: hypothetical protein H0Z37_06745 [Firmicutes bacterium]|nr:hypothetical protein [Bacillota bacterium]